MGVNGGTYKLVVVLHVLTAIIGFGAVFLNGIYGQQAKSRKGPEGLAIAQANYLVSRIAEFFIYAVFVFGVLLVLLSDGRWSFGDSWIWSSMVLYVVGIGLSHGLLIPDVRRTITLMEEIATLGNPPSGGVPGPPPQLAELDQRGRRVGAVSTVLDLLLVAILALMVWGPRFG